MRKRAAAITRPIQTRKPTERASFWNASIVRGVASSGPFRAMIVEPMIHSPQPTFPKKDRYSLRKMEARMALMTTERAPRGVTRIASVKEYAIYTVARSGCKEMWKS
jgi:hypothetical protein